MTLTDTFIVLACLALILLFPTVTRGGDVPWLSDVATPPDSCPPPVRRLSNLLRTIEGAPITTRQDWEAERERLRQQWHDLLGPMPDPPPLDPVVLQSEDLGDVVRSLIEYAGEPDLRVQAYVLTPRTSSSDPLPGLVALHPTTALTIDAIAGVAGDPSQHTGLRLARAGFVVVCPRCYLWQDAEQYQEAVERHARRYPHTLGMAKMLYDARRGVDLLLAQPQVDPERIGGFGHSLGAKELLYLMAFDDRVQAGVASEGGIPLDSTNWDAPWYLGPACREPDFPRDHHELLALTVPRPLLIIGGERGPGAADGLRTWPYLAAAQQVYSLYDVRPRLGLLNHEQGHPLPESAFEQAVEWLEVYLSR